MSLPAKEAMLAQIGKFVRGFTLLTSPGEVTPEQGVPDVWVEMLRSQEASRKTWAGPWEPFRERLPGVLDFLEHKVHGVCVLLKANQPPSLLYVYGRVEDLYFYRGGSALGDVVPDDPRSIWARLPLKLREFYSTLHNGWTELSSDSMGPLPLQDIEFLAGYDWSDDWPEEVNTLPFRLENVAAVFGNGGGDSLCLDLSLSQEVIEAHALCWWHEDVLEPDLDINFWDLLDGWICGQLEDVAVAD